MDNYKKLYPSAQTGGGVRQRIGSMPPVKVGSPGPGRPGLSRFRPHDAELGATDTIVVVSTFVAARPLVLSQAVNRAAYY